MRAIPSLLERRHSRHPTKDQSAPAKNECANVKGGLGAGHAGDPNQQTSDCRWKSDHLNEMTLAVLFDIDRPHGGLLQGGAIDCY